MFYLATVHALYDNRDAIRGTVTHRLDQYGTMETEGWAHALACLARGHLGLDDGDDVHLVVMDCATGRRVVPPMPAWWHEEDLPF